MTLREDKSILIEEYSLVDFVLSIQKTVQAGYEISLENKNFPSGFSGHFTVGMVDAKPSVETSTTTTLKDDSSPVTDTVGTVVAETSKDAVEAHKQATVKRTTTKK